MSDYKSYAPNVKVSGEVVLAFKNGFPAEALNLGLAILAEKGINDPKPGAYYELQHLFDAMGEVESKFSRQMLHRIGYNIANNAKLPPEMNSMLDALAGIDAAYHMNHVGGEIGHYAIQSSIPATE